ncbi:hypothetical protein Zm00014a_025454 [Zea mays]|uniref:Uncharacterized protein n=1 Tax=Zea mays TaxID=4577 RepID=A0A3L6F8Z4_MAIZE|nr:hypothetical protein Zm00014a_025454 [Zea mays]
MLITSLKIFKTKNWATLSCIGPPKAVRLTHFPSPSPSIDSVSDNRDTGTNEHTCC